MIPLGSPHFQLAAPYHSNVKGTVSPFTRHSCNADGHIYQCGNLLAIMVLDFFRVVIPLGPSHFQIAAPFHVNVKGTVLPFARHRGIADEHNAQPRNLLALVGSDFF